MHASVQAEGQRLRYPREYAICVGFSIDFEDRQRRRIMLHLAIRGPGPRAPSSGNLGPSRPCRAANREPTRNGTLETPSSKRPSRPRASFGQWTWAKGTLRPSAPCLPTSCLEINESEIYENDAQRSSGLQLTTARHREPLRTAGIARDLGNTWWPLSRSPAHGCLLWTLRERPSLAGSSLLWLRRR